MMDKIDWVKTAINAVRVITFVCDIITFPIYLAIQQPWKRQERSKRVKVSDFNILFFFLKLATFFNFKVQYLNFKCSFVYSFLNSFF